MWLGWRLLDKAARREAAGFYVIAFGLAVIVALASPWLGPAVLLLTMFTPLVAVLVMKLVIVRDGRTRAGWAETGIGRAGLPYWPLAVLLPLAVILPGYLAVWLGPAGTVSGPGPDVDPLRDTFRLVVNIILGTLLGGLGEEIGWRGYLLPRLAAMGAGRASLATGFAHGVWHLPLILLTPFYHSEGQILLIVPLFLVTLTLGGGVYGWLRLSSASVWPAALAHTVFNDAWERLDTATTYHAGWTRELLAGESGIACIGMLALTTFVLWRYPPRRRDDGRDAPPNGVGP